LATVRPLPFDLPSVRRKKLTVIADAEARLIALEAKP
jgi:hypothetical protein